MTENMKPWSFFQYTGELKLSCRPPLQSDVSAEVHCWKGDPHHTWALLFSALFVCLFLCTVPHLLMPPSVSPFQGVCRSSAAEKGGLHHHWLSQHCPFSGAISAKATDHWKAQILQGSDKEFLGVISSPMGLCLTSLVQCIQWSLFTSNECGAL